jgi:hypothetical protein
MIVRNLTNFYKHSYGRVEEEKVSFGKKKVK